MCMRLRVSRSRWLARVRLYWLRFRFPLFNNRYPWLAKPEVIPNETAFCLRSISRDLPDWLRDNWRTYRRAATGFADQCDFDQVRGNEDRRHKFIWIDDFDGRH